MPNGRIQKTVANAGIRNTTPAGRTSFAQLAHSRAVSPSLNGRISETNVRQVTTSSVFTGGRTIGLLLALTYSTVTSTTTTLPGGYSPHARIT